MLSFLRAKSHSYLWFLKSESDHDDDYSGGGGGGKEAKQPEKCNQTINYNCYDSGDWDVFLRLYALFAF